MMVLQSAAPKAAQDTPWHWKLLHLISCMAPFIIGLIALPLNGMRNSVFVWPGGTLLSLLAGLLLQLILAVAWIMFEMRVISNDQATSSHIKEKVGLSLAVTLTAVFVAGLLLGLGILPWWFVIPAISAVVDAWQVLQLGIINALQKPLFEQNETR